ncbi:MAG: ribosome small subunit-dependent GTPase A [Acholeplasmataceae bacterium]|nr:ribosome small subunit-dependent GTPase A [Acidaminococcaceae bacterium]NLY83253.1 ribosome small subunit-dependent GTPase A [Acholeplasmataceae bacterium]
MTEQGRVIKNYMGYYYVETAERRVFTCKVKGRMKQNRFSLCTGDYVVFEAKGTEGMITEVLPRKNFLQRPTVANIDLVVVTASCANPEFSFLITDKLLVLAESAGIPAVICLNKTDLAPPDLLQQCREVYGRAGYKVLPVSARQGDGLEQLRNEVANKVTVFAGPSGVGKSSTLNAIDPCFQRVVGVVSEKIGRGRHTTRCADFIPFAGGYLADTPGFGNLNMEELEVENLAAAFPEFAEYSRACRFNGCSHTHEPGCEVKAAVERGEIASSRYKSYLSIEQEIPAKKERSGKK